VADKVTIAYVHSNEVAHSWHMSLLDLIGYDLSNGGRVVSGGWLAMRCGTDGLQAARNLAVAKFLSEKDADWLFWIDTDMGFGPDTVERLLEAADPLERPIVGALCFAQKEQAGDGMNGYRCAPRPTILDWIGEGFQGRTQYPVNALVRCGATGSAAILIHRSVLERIAEKDGGPVWYDRIPKPDGERFGEDISFCIRAGAAGFPVFIHTGVRTSHLKNLWLAEQDYWQHAVPQPATEQTAVIVPVLDRPQNAAPFMASLRATTGMATVYAVANHDDHETVKAWDEAGAVVLYAEGVSFAAKVNEGYRQTTEPWLFLVGDDVRFYPGWLDHAQAVAGDDFDVVGTNDLGNPRVTSGEHATHMLIRRSHVDKVGASWDGPGVVAHEGYRHWFVDDEIVAAAKQRGVWAMALGSIVEHLHPAWGKGEQDETYRLGQSHAAKDQATFEKRLKARQAAEVVR